MRGHVSRGGFYTTHSHLRMQVYSQILCDSDRMVTGLDARLRGHVSKACKTSFTHSCACRSLVEYFLFRLTNGLKVICGLDARLRGHVGKACKPSGTHSCACRSLAKKNSTILKNKFLNFIKFTI